MADEFGIVVLDNHGILGQVAACCRASSTFAKRAADTGRGCRGDGGVGTDSCPRTTHAPSRRTAPMPGKPTDMEPFIIISKHLHATWLSGPDRGRTTTLKWWFGGWHALRLCEGREELA